MVFLLNWVAILIMGTIAPHSSPQGDPLAYLLESHRIQQLVLTGNQAGLAVSLANFLLSGSDKPDLADAPERLEALKPGLLEKFLPDFSALTLGERLLSLDPDKRFKESGRLISEGVFRKLSISGDVAPELLSASLAWAKRGEPAEPGRRALKMEQERLKSEAEKLLRDAAESRAAGR